MQQTTEISLPMLDIERPIRSAGAGRTDCISRRVALKRLAAGGIALALGRNACAASQTPLLERTIPKSGELLPAVGLGTYRAFDVDASSAERAPLREVLELFAQAGGKAVDSSPMYGNAERVVGDLATELGLTKSLFLATKVWTTGRDAGLRQMEESFRLLRTDRIDLMQIHNLLDVETQVKTLRAWKEQGRIRYLGVTHYTESAYRELARQIESGRYDFVQINYSILEREAEREILPLAAARGVAVIVNRPFAQGGLFSKARDRPLPPWADEFDCASWAQFFLKYVLAHPAVTCVIPATSKARHLLDNMGAGVGRLPDEATRRRMVELIDSL